MVHPQVTKGRSIVNDYEMECIFPIPPLFPILTLVHIEQFFFFLGCLSSFDMYRGRQRLTVRD